MSERARSVGDSLTVAAGHCSVRVGRHPLRGHALIEVRRGSVPVVAMAATAEQVGALIDALVARRDAMRRSAP